MKSIAEFMDMVKARNPNEPEFHQAVHEVVETIWEEYNKNPRMVKGKILERIVEPERAISFRVPWVDDKGEIQVNRGYRVQFNSAIGPYKGGLRFHPSVNLSILKFLGFEQMFKNALTTLPMGGGKGGSDFNPKGRSDNEIMRFCQSFMTELYRHIGSNLDVPAGDIGVGGREIGYMFGQYKRIANEFTGVFTGKGATWGGSLIRPEATGFGAIYFGIDMLATKGETFKGKTIALSGFGNVTWGSIKKLIELGAKCITISGPDGYVLDEEGFNEEKCEYLLDMRASCNDQAEDYVKKYPKAKFFAKEKPWSVKCDVAVLCATQNECSADDVKKLAANGCKLLLEVSNMGCTADGAKLAHEKMMFAPGKAANAGGVAVSGLEMTQNSERLNWTAEEVDAKLKHIMHSIHAACVKHGKEGDRINYIKGANVAGFMKVATAMLDQGVV
ncbi:MAG TPA: NADP-specific glutamate dehydrogenase [Candidatus Riflebacteria bacterium]|jgi:glutamate dehydrogenase (NADP+)|nr:NADP-specific glutamate dehydrogenase [Candidatus Riflebacteria bacterium]